VEDAMTRTKHTDVLSVLHPICCGLDVHKEVVNACLVVTNSAGKDVSVFKVFQTFTDDLKRLREWLLAHECPIVAMESTGVYWRSVHNILEGYLRVVLVNARHVKNMPGRKTDTADSQWIAGLLRVGMVKGGFIPPKEVRRWRDINGYRKRLVETVGDAKRRVHKLFECCNVKIDSVVTDLFGRTGRNLMNLLIAKPCQEITEEDVKVCLKGKLKPKGAELFRSIQGFFEDHHRWLLQEQLDIIDSLQERIKGAEARLKELFDPYKDLMKRMLEIPGINLVAAYAILSEIGTTLDAFCSAAALCSWCGVCPGNNQSAGKRFHTRSPVRSSRLRTFLVEAAWAAVRVKGTYFRAKYFSLRARLGPKKAILAIAHRLLKGIYHVVKHGSSFRDLGEDYLININRLKKLNYVIRLAEKLGFRLVPAPL
jgi:transposase